MASFYGFSETNFPATPEHNGGLPKPVRRGPMSDDRKAYKMHLRDLIRARELTSLTDLRLHKIIEEVVSFNRMEHTRENYKAVRLDIRNVLFNKNRKRRPPTRPVFPELQAANPQAPGAHMICRDMCGIIIPNKKQAFGMRRPYK